MHKRKDYYHAGGDNGKGLRKELQDLNQSIELKYHKPEFIHSEPPDEKPSLLKRFTNFLKNRKA